MPFLALLLLQRRRRAAVPRPCASTTSTRARPSEEGFALDGLALEGPWPGHPARAIDDTGLGKYRFEVKDAASGRLLYSRGFASVFGEWETTAEAKERARAFHESLRFPLPAAKARVVAEQARGRRRVPGVWSLGSTRPTPPIDRSGPPAAARVWPVIKNGDPRDKVDLLLMGDGYTAAEMDKWHADARRLAGILFAASPFKERRRDFNVWAVDIAVGRERRRAPVGRRSSAGRALRAALRRLRLRALRAGPRQQAAARGRGGRALRVHRDRRERPQVRRRRHPQPLRDRVRRQRVHALRVRPRVRPSLRRPRRRVLHVGGRVRVTERPAGALGAERDRRSQGGEVEGPDRGGHALPTPWEKETFEAAQRDSRPGAAQIRADKRPETEMEALFREEREQTTALLARGPHARAVGAFEGAMYEATGLLPPAGGLHHVHARRGRLLRGLPPRDRARDRPVHSSPALSPPRRRLQERCFERASTACTRRTSPSGVNGFSSSWMSSPSTPL